MRVVLRARDLCLGDAHVVPHRRPPSFLRPRREHRARRRRRDGGSFPPHASARRPGRPRRPRTAARPAARVPGRGSRRQRGRRAGSTPSTTVAGFPAPCVPSPPPPPPVTAWRTPCSPAATGGGSYCTALLRRPRGEDRRGDRRRRPPDRGERGHSRRTGSRPASARSSASPRRVARPNRWRRSWGSRRSRSKTTSRRCFPRWCAEPRRAGRGPVPPTIRAPRRRRLPTRTVRLVPRRLPGHGGLSALDVGRSPGGTAWPQGFEAVESWLAARGRPRAEVVSGRRALSQHGSGPRWL